MGIAQFPKYGKIPDKYLAFMASLTGICFLATGSVQAQIAADNTVSTKVKSSEGVWKITGGTKAESNLFHSFSEFSLPTGDTAYFKNATNISNIISRVTGSSISNIDGLIKANGNANLILINPNGINFGANASLEIGGSFFGSTANSVVFEDGKTFSANETQGTPSLTVSVPVGLQMGQNSGAINVTGNGHNLTVADPLFSPTVSASRPGLQVSSGETFALLGKGLVFDGGAIATLGGRIELGSVGEGTVTINDGQLNYEDISVWENITMRSQSLADASGTPTIAGGSIQVGGKQLSLENGSLLLVQNQAQQPAGTIEVNTSEAVTVQGTNPDGTIRSSITNETVGAGKGGDVIVNTGDLTVDGGATIVAKTLFPGNGVGGNLTIDATNSIRVIGASATNPSVTSSIVAASFGAGDSGNNSITTKNLSLSAGGTIAATTFSTGNGGDLNITAENIELVGIEPTVFAPSALTAATLGAGDAGVLTIDTATLNLLNGGRVDASTAATGNAGNIVINASEAIEVKGGVDASINPSLIISSANILDPALREILRVPDVPTGNSGNVTINTPQLQVTEGAQVTVRNDGIGDGGNLNINSSEILLDTGGGITAATQTGQGGDIRLQGVNSLEMQRGSQISSENFGAGDGGEIYITTSNLQMGDRAFISTTTFGAGQGGDINIDAQDSLEIVGTGFAEFRQQFQLGAFQGTLQPGDRGTGIFIGTVSTGQGGNLNLNTASLNLSEGAILFSPAFVAGSGGDLNISASEIELVGSAIQSGTSIVSSESAFSGDINIETERLNIQDGATVINLTFGSGAGGDVNITATDSINIKDSPPDAILVTGIYTNTSVGSGTGGNIQIQTGNFNIQDGVVASNSGGLLPDGTIIPVGGIGGDINIQASGTINVVGDFLNPILTSGIGASTYSASSAGNLTISTERLIIRDAADFSVATLGGGDGGTLTINASDSIELIGTKNSNAINQGGLFASSGRPNFPGVEATGASGDIVISTGDLIVRDGATVNVQSLGMGDSGELKISADSILLDNGGTISAATQSGVGGNINLQADNIFGRRGSETTATAGGTADGGNIQIEAQNLIVLENSKLTANAERGRGGNIQINTQNFFICPECIVSASSELGVDGQVNLNVLEPNTNLETVNLPQQLTQAEDIVTLACSTPQNSPSSTLNITGRGGLPPRPSETLSSESLVSFTDNNSATENGNPNTVNSPLPPPARGWYVTSQGEVILTSNSVNTVPFDSRANVPDCQIIDK